jgi:hypothetical protein
MCALGLLYHIPVCVFITAGPMIKLCAGGEGPKHSRFGCFHGTREEPGTLIQGAPV